MKSKKYLIVCPSALEASLFMEHAVAIDQSIALFSLKYFRLNTDLLISGIGISKTTHSLTKALLKTTYDLVIHMGIAGSFDKNIPLTSVVNIVSETFGDLGIESQSGFSSLFDLGLNQKNSFPFVDGILLNNTNKPLFFNPFEEFHGITVNSILTNKEKNDQRKNQFKAQIESMEGAAVFYVCLMENIDFIEIRSISNYVGERDKNKWKINEAVEVLNKNIVDFLKSDMGNNGKK